MAERTPPLTCLCFLLDLDHPGGPRVLLGEKQRGLGAGKVVGLGGHVEPGETARAAAAREVHEESGIVVDATALDARAEIEFRFPARAAWEMDVEAFVGTTWSGEPVETDEIVPVWHPVDRLPLHRMWADAAHWLPRILAGERLRARFTFAADNAAVERSELTIVQGLDSGPLREVR